MSAQIAALRAQGKTESTSKKLAKLVSQQGESKSTASSTPSTASTGGFEDVVARTQALVRQSLQPAVQSFQSSVPEIQQRFDVQRQQLEAEKAPLQQRYQQLLSQIKGSEQQAISREELAQSQELGRRGILPSSGLYEQTLSKAVQPIAERFGGLTADVGFEQEAGLRNLQNLITGLPLQETEAIRNVQNAIAQLQAGGEQTALSSALSLLGQQQQAQQFGQTFGLRQQEIQNAVDQFNKTLGLQQATGDLTRRVFEETTKPESAATIQNLLSQIAARGSGVGLTAEDILSGIKLPSSFTPD